MENKNTSRVVIGVLVVLVLLLGGYIAVSGAARGGKSAVTATGSTGASEAAALPMETYQAQYVKPETPIDRSKNVTLPGWGQTAELSHYLRLAGIQAQVTGVTDADPAFLRSKKLTRACTPSRPSRTIRAKSP